MFQGYRENNNHYGYVSIKQNIKWAYLTSHPIPNINFENKVKSTEHYEVFNMLTCFQDERNEEQSQVNQLLRNGLQLGKDNE